MPPKRRPNTSAAAAGDAEGPSPAPPANSTRARKAARTAVIIATPSRNPSASEPSSSRTRIVIKRPLPQVKPKSIVLTTKGPIAASKVTKKVVERGAKQRKYRGRKVDADDESRKVDAIDEGRENDAIDESRKVDAIDEGRENDAIDEGREKGAKQRKQRKSQGRENDAIDEGRARSRLEPQFEVIEDPADREITVRFDTLNDPFETPFETPSRAPRSRTSLPSQRRQNTTAPLPLKPHEANIHFSIEPRFLGVASVPIVRPFQVVWRLKTSLAGNIIAMRWDKQLLKETRDRIRSQLQGQYHLTKRWISIEFGERKATAKTSVTYFRNDFSAVDGKWPVLPWAAIAEQLESIDRRLSDVFFTVEIVYTAGIIASVLSTPVQSKTVAAVNEPTGAAEIPSQKPRGRPVGRPPRFEPKKAASNEMIDEVVEQAKLKERLFQQLTKHHQCADQASCRNSSGQSPDTNWCFVIEREHFQLTPRDFELWQEAILKRQPNTSIDNPPPSVVVAFTQRHAAKGMAKGRVKSMAKQSVDDETAAGWPIGSTATYPTGNNTAGNAVVNLSFGSGGELGQSRWPQYLQSPPPWQYQPIDPTLLGPPPQTPSRGADPIPSSSPPRYEEKSPSSRQIEVSEFIEWFVDREGDRWASKGGTNEALKQFGSVTSSLAIVWQLPIVYFSELGIPIGLIRLLKRSIKDFLTIQGFRKRSRQSSIAADAPRRPSKLSRVGSPIVEEDEVAEGVEVDEGTIQSHLVENGRFDALFVSSPPGPSPISSPSLRPSQLLPDTLQGQYFDVDDDNDRENNTVDLPGAKAADPIQVEDGTSSTESYSGGE